MPVVGSHIGIGRRRHGRAGASPFVLDENGNRSLISANYDRARYGYDGQGYPDEAAFNTALGLTKSGITRQTAAPVLIGPDLVSNGNNPTVTTGWSAFLSGTLAAVAARFVLTGNGGNTPSMSQQVAAALGNAYRLSADITRGGGELGQILAAGTNANMSGAALNVSASATGSYAGTFGAVAPSQYVGTKLNANPANGTGTINTIAVQRAIPFAGFGETSVLGLSGVIQGVTPAAAAGSKVIWQIDDGSERNRLRLAWGADTHLHLISSYNNVAVADIDLGVVAVSTPFRVAHALANGIVRASIDGKPVQQVAGQNPPGICWLRIGRSFTGETWDGAIISHDFWPVVQSANMVETLSGNAINCIGDSLTAGSGASNSLLTSYPVVLSGLLSPIRAVSRNGYAGQNSDYIDTQMAGFNRALLARLTIIQSGRNDVGTGVDTAAGVARMASRVISRRYLVGSILPSVADGDLASATSLDRLARNAALAAAHGVLFVEHLPALQAAGDGGANDNSDIANGWVPRSLRADDVHLNDAGYAILAQNYYAALVARGWDGAELLPAA